LGGVTAVAKVKITWPDNENIQNQVQNLAGLMASELKACADEM
jgi:hypothetical protein